MPYKDPERRRQHTQEWKEKNLDRFKATQKKRYLRIKDQIKAANRLRFYGLTEDEYQKMLNDQEGLCAICFESTTLVIDHDHASGYVRGLLCQGCNLGLGQLKDSTIRLKSAIEYLERK